MVTFKSLRYPKLRVKIPGVKEVVAFSNFEFKTDNPKIISALKKNTKVTVVNVEDKEASNKDSKSTPSKTSTPKSTGK